MSIVTHGQKVLVPRRAADFRWVQVVCQALLLPIPLCGTDVAELGRLKRKLKKRISVMVILGSALIILAWTAPAFVSATRSERLWRELQTAVAHKDMVAARRILTDTDEDLHEISNDRILYYGRDFTEQLGRTPVRFWKTVEYYMTDPQNRFHDKLILKGGYAIIDQGQITFLKFP